MRNAFIKTLMAQAPTHPELYFLVGDLGFGFIEQFQSTFPKQFANIGVAEQNMTGVAAGLALSGKTVFTYSIANFTILRPLEQVRVDICYHNANVKLISSGSGFHYYSLGATHHATEDLAIMRALPNMTIVSPGDPQEAEHATRAFITTHKGPAYMRITGRPTVYSQPINFEIGKSIEVREGNDLTLIATGGMLYDAVVVADNLASKGIKARVISMHTIKPLDTEAVLKAANETGEIYTIEDHSVVGGLGGACAETLAENYTRLNGKFPRFHRFGIRDQFVKDVGSVDYIREQLGLSSTQITEKILELRAS